MISFKHTVPPANGVPRVRPEPDNQLLETIIASFADGFMKFYASHARMSMSRVEPIPYLFLSLDSSETSRKAGVGFTPAFLASRQRS